MARSKKPRKPYKPPACRVQQLVKGCLSLERTVAGVQPYTDARKAEIAITHRLELQRICTGKGTMADLDQLSSSTAQLWSWPSASAANAWPWCWPPQTP